jgi:hypothetical protein
MNWFHHEPSDFVPGIKRNKLPIVYVFATCELDYIKIGKTKSVKQRLSNVQSGCPFHLHLWIAIATPKADEIEKFLIKNNIKYIREYKFINCINSKTNKKLPFDFYIPSLNTIIEFHGEQHYKEYKNHFKAAGGLKGRQYRDKIKKEFCLTNNINYIEIAYTEYNNINQILNNICV